MDVISERLQQSLTLTAAQQQRDKGEEACSRPVAGGAHSLRVPTAALPPRSVPASGALVPHTKTYGPSSVHQRRSFVRPGGVASAWARCVGVQRTVNVRKRPTGDFDGAPGGDGGAVLTGQHVSGLADMAAFLRQRKRRIVTEAAKLMDPHPEPGPGEANNLVNLPTDLLMKIVCLLRHNELWPLLATSRRLRQAAAAAISVHFNFCTPEPQRDERDAVLPVLRSPSPRYVHAALLAQREAWGVPDAPFRHHARRRRPTKAAARTEAPMLGLPAPGPPLGGAAAGQPSMWRPDLMLRSPPAALPASAGRAAAGGAGPGAAGTPSEGGASYLVPAAWPSPSVVVPAQLEMTPPPPGHKYGTRLSFGSVRGGGDDDMGEGGAL